LFVRFGFVSSSSINADSRETARARARSRFPTTVCVGLSVDSIDQFFTPSLTVSSLLTIKGGGGDITQIDDHDERRRNESINPSIYPSIYLSF